MSLSYLLGTVASYHPPVISGTILSYQSRAFSIIGLPTDQVIARKTNSYIIVFP